VYREPLHVFVTLEGAPEIADEAAVKPKLKAKRAAASAKRIFI